MNRKEKLIALKERVDMVPCESCPFLSSCDILYDTFGRNFCDSIYDEIARLKRGLRND